MAARQADQRYLAWQTLDSGRLLLAGSVTILLIAALVLTALRHVSDPGLAVAFGVCIALGELLVLSLPGGRQTAPVAMSAALAYTMILYVASAQSGRGVLATPAASPAMQVIAVTAIGMAAGALPHVAAGRDADVTGTATRLFAVACVVFVFHSLFTSPLGHIHRYYQPEFWIADIAVVAALATFGWLLETVIMAILRAEDLRVRYAIALADELAVQWPLGLAVGGVAVITVLGVELFGTGFVIAVFAGPLLVFWLAFRQYAGIRSTYLETVQALAQATDVGGYTKTGHSRRVSMFALAIGRELGLREHDLLDLEYAALMHDIGQLALVEPTPGGATFQLPAAAARRVAELGAEVISRTGVLDTVAEIVRYQWLPFRGGPAEPPLGSRIVRVANAFDDMVAGTADRSRMTAALSRLRADSGTKYDPVVVKALASVAARMPISRLL